MPRQASQWTFTAALGQMDPTQSPWLQQRRTLYDPDTNRLHPQNTGEKACRAWARQELFALATPPDCTRTSKWGRELEPGQLQHATSFFEERWNWSTGKVHRFLSDLEAEDEICRIDPDDRASTEAKVIEVCNYMVHQRPWENGGKHSGKQNGKGSGKHPEGSGGTKESNSDGSERTERKAPRKAERKAKRNQVKEEKKKEKENNNMAPEAGAPRSKEPFDQTNLSNSETDDAESRLERQVREVEQHWIDLLANLDLTSEEQQVLLSSDKREHARSKFRARIRDDSFTPDDLQHILTWALSQYWYDDDRLPWGGNVHPRSIIQNGDKARERMLRMRKEKQNGSRTSEASQVTRLSGSPSQARETRQRETDELKEKRMRELREKHGS